MSTRYDVCVVGGGSGGFGAALSAGRMGLRVLLIERGDCLGGTSVRGGVHCWEMGIGGTGIPRELYDRLTDQPGAVGVYSFARHGCWHDPSRQTYRFLGGETVIDPTRTYDDTLRRYGCPPGGMAANETWCREHWHGVPFEPEAMASAMATMLAETGNVTVQYGTLFRDADVTAGHAGKKVSRIALADGTVIEANMFIDCSGDGTLCAAAGCERMTGQESRDRFGESLAPEEANEQINGVSLIFRISPRTDGVETIEPLPSGMPAECWWADTFPWISMNHYPGGDRNINMLPTMTGQEFRQRGPNAAMAECRRRIHAQWHHMQTVMPEFQTWHISWIAPMLGVRESWRVVGEYVLTQNDLEAGLSEQDHEDIICIADHAMDTHGAATGRTCGELTAPYGIPYRCLVPRGFENLLVACRAASFSSLAASSARLSRTMMQLGQAAGTACAIARQTDVPLAACPPHLLHDALNLHEA